MVLPASAKAKILESVKSIPKSRIRECVLYAMFNAKIDIFNNYTYHAILDTIQKPLEIISETKFDKVIDEVSNILSKVHDVVDITPNNSGIVNEMNKHIIEKQTKRMREDYIISPIQDDHIVPEITNQSGTIMTLSDAIHDTTGEMDYSSKKTY